VANRVDREKWEARLRAVGLTGRLPDRLTERVVDAVQKRPTGERYMLSDGRGLALAVYPDGAASWVLQTRTLAGKPKRCGLGSAKDTTLEAARAKADELRAVIKAGGDPVAEKRAARIDALAAEASTLERFVADTYAPLLVSKNRKDAGGAAARIRASWAPLLARPVAQITEADINATIEARKALKKEDGSRLLSDATLRRDWATFRPCLVHARKVKLLAHLPIEGKPEPLQGLREEPSRRYIGKDDSAEMKRFLDALAAFKSAEPTGGDFIRLACALALNAGLRRGEVVRLSDEMIHLAAGREHLELPARICKGNRSRQIPLNAPAIAAIKSWKLRGVNGELFPATRSCGRTG
jgi:hypothetical protein